MIIECIPNGLIQSNAYLIAGNGEAVVIDCGCKPERVLQAAERNGAVLKHIILTHGHFDHIYYIDELRKQADVKVHIHETDAPCLTDPYLNGLALIPVDGTQTFKPADNLLNDGDMLECGGIQFQILHTPGHTRGCICIHAENFLFTGDTLFKMSVGRTDLPGGSMKEIDKSIREKLYSLPEETIVYPGHGLATTIGFEKKRNPFFRA